MKLVNQLRIINNHMNNLFLKFNHLNEMIKAEY